MKKSLERLEMIRLAKREKLDRMWRRLNGSTPTETSRKASERRQPRWAR